MSSWSRWRGATLGPLLFLVALAAPLTSCASTEEQCEGIFAKIANGDDVSDADKSFLNANCAY